VYLWYLGNSYKIVASLEVIFILILVSLFEPLWYQILTINNIHIIINIQGEYKKVKHKVKKGRRPFA
jgi:uncharacterized membrane protein